MVYLKTDSQSTTFNGVAGVNRFEAPLEVGSGVEVLVVSCQPIPSHNGVAHGDALFRQGRNGQSVASVTIPDYTFTANPVRYNFSMFISRIRRVSI